jgi:DNA modification methylase
MTSVAQQAADQLALAEVLSGARSWAVIKGDARKLLPLLPEGSVDHVIADPPYSRHVHANVMSGHDRASGGYGREVRLGFARLDRATRNLLAREAARVSKRWAIFFTDVESTGRWKRSLVDAGLDYVRTGAWVRLNPTPQFSGDRPAAGFDAIAIAHAQGRKIWNGGGLPAVWEHAVVMNRGKVVRVHETEKPIGLMNELVRLFTDPGEVVLDPMCGSGSTGVACLNQGRRFIGIERSARDARMSRERLADAENLTTREARGRSQGALFAK